MKPSCERHCISLLICAICVILTLIPHNKVQGATVLPPDPICEPLRPNSNDPNIPALNNLWEDYDFRKIDEDVVDPAIPSSDYVEANKYDDEEEQIWGFTDHDETVTGYSTVTDIYVHMYGNGHASPLTARLNIDGTWTSTQSIDPDSGWHEIVFTGSWTLAQLDSLQLGLKTPKMGSSNTVEIWAIYCQICGPPDPTPVPTATPMPKVIYVDESVTAGGDGTSWVNAYDTLDEALDLDNLWHGDTIRVAEGVYEGHFEILRSVVTIEGGWGYNGTAWVQDSETYRTTLDGTPTPSGPTLTVSTGAYSAVLKSLRITGGTPGIEVQDSQLTLNDCLIYENSAEEGGGLSVDESTVYATNTSFYNNTAESFGGAAVFVADSPSSGFPSLFTNCTFLQNTANSAGGAVYCQDTSGPKFLECTFRKNSAASAGALGYASAPLPTEPIFVQIADSLFLGNSATTGSGGGLYIGPGFISEIDRCQFRANTSTVTGGAVYLKEPYDDVYATFIRNCLFVYNHADWNGGALDLVNIPDSTFGISYCTYTHNSATGDPMNSVPASGAISLRTETSEDYSYADIGNSIFWKTGNLTPNNQGTPGIIAFGEGTQELTVNQSFLEWSGFSGSGNITSGKPGFIDDDNNWRLRQDSQCVDTNSGTGSVAVDLEDNTRPVSVPGAGGSGNSIHDMGAYERQHSNADPVLARDRVGVQTFISFFFDGKHKPGFPEEDIQPYHFVPDLLDPSMELLKDLRVNSVRGIMPWTLIEPIRDQFLWVDDSGTLVDNPFYDASAGEWECSDCVQRELPGYNSISELPPGYDPCQDLRGTPPLQYDNADWLCIGDSRPFKEINDSQYPAGNLGYLKANVRAYRTHLEDYITALEDSDIEFLAWLGTPVPWFSSDPLFSSPCMPADDLPDDRDIRFLHFEGATNNTLKRLEQVYQLMASRYTSPGHPVKALTEDYAFDAYKDYVSLIETKFPDIDRYEVFIEPNQQSKFFDSVNQVILDGNTFPPVRDMIIDPWYYWLVLNRTKDALGGSPNKIHLDLGFASIDTPSDIYGSKLKYPDDLQGYWFMDLLIDGTDLNPDTLAVPTTTPTNQQRVNAFKGVVDVMGLNPHDFGAESAVLHQTPEAHGKKNANRIDYFFQYQYPGKESTGRVNVYDDMEVWIPEIASRRCRTGNCEAASAHLPRMFTWFDDAAEMIAQKDNLYEQITQALADDRIDQVIWFNLKDASRKRPAYNDDAGLVDFHFTKENKSTTLVSGAPNTWEHPLTRETKTSDLSKVFDWYYSDKVSHYPAYYGMKAINRELPNPTIPYLLSLTDADTGDPLNWLEHSAEDDLRFQYIPCANFGNDEEESLHVTFSEPFSIGGELKLLLDGIEIATAWAYPHDVEVVFTIKAFDCSTSLTDGEKDTLKAVSRYHRLSVEFDGDNCGDEYVGRQFGRVETPFKYVWIEDDDKLDPWHWNYSYSPDDNDYVVLADYDFNTVGSFQGSTRLTTSTWKARSFHMDSPDPSTETFIEVDAIPGTMGGVIFTGEDPASFCNQTAVAENCPCCDNITVSGTDCGECELCTECTGCTECTDCDDCFANHSCTPDCERGETQGNEIWEGGEMWVDFSTDGYENIIIEYRIKTSGISDTPHGVIPNDQRFVVGGFSRHPYPDGSVTNFPQLYLPYQFCKNPDPDFLADCPSAFLFDEHLGVYCSFNNSLGENDPYDPGGVPDSATIKDYWLPLEIVSRGKLKSYEEEWGWRRVDLSLYKTTAPVSGDSTGTLYNGADDNPGLGLWFRSNLDSSNDKIYIDHVRVIGQKENLLPVY